jgi:hypothetical protein
VENLGEGYKGAGLYSWVIDWRESPLKASLKW